MTLNIQGFRIDTIVPMSSTCTAVDETLVEEARIFLGISLASSTHEDEQTLWRLLLADQWSHDERLNHGPMCFRDQTSPGKKISWRKSIPIPHWQYVLVENCSCRLAMAIEALLQPIQTSEIVSVDL